MSYLKMRKDSFAILPNVAFGFNSDFHLKKDEIMVYIHLQFIKQIGLENMTRTYIDMLVNDLNWNTSTPTRDKKNMIGILESLENKGYIKIDFDGKLSKSLLTITINQEMKSKEVETYVEWKEKSFNFKGFTKINGESYNLAEGNGYKMIVIAYVSWRANAQFTYQIAFKEWESVLGVTDKTARLIINDCEDVINKESGEYYRNQNGKLKQETNKYSVKTKKNNVTSKIDSVTSKVKSISVIEKLKKEISDPKVHSNEDILNQIFDKKTYIKFDGYKVWKETNCEIVKKAGQSKINSMKASKNVNAGEVADRLENEYQEYLIEKNKSQEWLKRQIENHDIEDTWTPSYKKKEESFFDIFEN